jgi:cyclophilin family peptidyl-prolyl cis-trans isomerase
VKLLSRLFSKRSPQSKPVRRVNCEPLEERRMLSATTLRVNSSVADNRGEVLIGFNEALDPTTITRSAIQMYTPGPDGKISTADDAFVTIHPHYSPSIFRITLEGNLPANTVFRVKIVGSRLKAMDGTLLDGDFHGTFPSGNGIQGGNFEFQTALDTSATPYVRMSTTYGVITLQMLRGKKPISVANFFSYADSGKYDNIVVSRDPSPTFILQMGALQINSSNVLVAPPAGHTIQNEFLTNGIVHNTLGTVGFAELGNNPNSATNEFYFNLQDNSANLDHQNGGFAVFARVANASSLTVMNNIDSLDKVALYNNFLTAGHGVAGPFTGVDISDVPVNDINVFSGNGSTEIIGFNSATQQPIFEFVPTGNFNPTRDLVTIRRTAVLVKVGPLVVPKS